MREPVILEVRLNEYTGRERNPHVPFSPEEIARDAAACAEAGAAIVHFHARDPETGAPSQDPALYAESIRRIRAAAPELIVLPTLGATQIDDPVERCAALREYARDPRTRPDLAPLDFQSVDVDPFVPGRGFAADDLVYRNSIRGLRGQLAVLREAKVKPDFVCWTIGGLRRLGAMLEGAEVSDPLFAELIVSDLILSCAPATSRGLLSLCDYLPRGRSLRWVALASGGSALPLAATAVEQGGGLALGLGDWAYPELGTPTNAGVIAEAARLVRACGSRPATPAEARAWLELPKA
jgi:uncharacterized protein (DUF849 family)